MFRNRTRMMTGAAAILLATTALTANAALIELEVTGITDGAWAGFPNTAVTQTAVYDTDAAPATTTFANVTTATYSLVSYALTFGATTMTPVGDWGGIGPVPSMRITNTTPGGPFGNPDAFHLGAQLNESYGGFTVKGMLLYSFDYSQVAITSTTAPTSLAWFSQFGFSNLVQLDVASATGSNFSLALRDQVVTLREVPEPATLGLLPLMLLAIRRR